MGEGRPRTPAELLATPVEYVRGVGLQRAALLAKLDIRTAGDLLFFFPRDYQDLTDRRTIRQLEEDQDPKEEGHSGNARATCRQHCKTAKRYQEVAFAQSRDIDAGT